MPNEQGVLPAATQSKFCLYARKSSEQDERQALSVESQIKEMREIAQREGLDIVVEKLENHSARKAGSRPEFNAMLEEIRAGKYNAILTWAADRLSRNAGDLGALVDLMDAKQLVEVRTFNQHFVNSPGEKFLLMIMGSQAKLENDNKGVNVSRGLRAAVEHGRWPGLAPLGYENQYRTDKKGVLRLDPVRAPMIQQMFEKVAYDRMSVRKVYKWLRDEAGFKTRKGRTWSLSSVYHALQSPFYYGMIEYPRKSGRWFKGLHIPLITKQLFDEVQMLITVEPAIKTHHEFAFTRLIKCGYCGSGICAVQKLKTLKSGVTVQYIYYSCSRGADHFCKAPSIREEDLLSELERIIDEIEVDELGMKTRFEAEIKRFTMFQNDILKKSGDQSSAQPTIDLKTYAKYILRNGSISEKRELLANMKSKLTLKDGRLSLI